MVIGIVYTEWINIHYYYAIYDYLYTITAYFTLPNYHNQVRLLLLISTLHDPPIPPINKLPSPLLSNSIGPRWITYTPHLYPLAIGPSPADKSSPRDLGLLLQLILCCAVQASKQSEYVNYIMILDNKKQHVIMESIKMVSVD